MPQLLLIDDDEQVRKVLRFRLKDSYEIVESGSPEEALALALQHRPDAVLLDLNMPGYSGFDVCQRLSSLSFTEKIPIIIISGESSARYQEFCDSIGAKAFFQKPIDVGALKTKLVELIQPRDPAPKTEPRVRLRVPVRLTGIDARDVAFEVQAVTDNVSATAFLCPCAAALKVDSVVEVFLSGNGQKSVGKARVVRVDFAGTPGQLCDFNFLEKPTGWIVA